MINIYFKLSNLTLTTFIFFIWSTLKVKLIKILFCRKPTFETESVFICVRKHIQQQITDKYLFSLE